MQYDPDNPKMIGVWFDAHNPMHVIAYNYLNSAGMWPKWFTRIIDEEGIIIHEQWQVLIAYKLANAWLSQQTRCVDTCPDCGRSTMFSDRCVACGYEPR